MLINAVAGGGGGIPSAWRVTGKGFRVNSNALGTWAPVAGNRTKYCMLLGSSTMTQYDHAFVFGTVRDVLLTGTDLLATPVIATCKYTLASGEVKYYRERFWVERTTFQFNGTNYDYTLWGEIVESEVESAAGATVYVDLTAYTALEAAE